jgi:O-antigen/teichoic acid export membrane protein
MAGIRGIARRLSWGLADQAVSSLTNFMVGVYVAHELGVAGFGVFTLAWVTYGVVLNLSRGLTTDPLVVRFSGVSNEQWSTATARSAGTALTVGAGFGVLSVLAGLAMGGAVGTAFVALGIVTPALLLQDSWRFAFFANGQGHRAVLNDLLWTVAMIPLLLVAAQHGDVAGFVLAWGGAALFAGVGGWLQTGIRPRPRQARQWLRQHRDLGTRYMVENSANSGAGQLRMYGVAAIVNVGAVGAIRGAELLLAPFMTLLMGLNLVTVPEAARVLRRSPHRLERFCVVLGGTQAVAALGWGLALLFLVPESVGQFVLNDVWDFAAPLILPVSVSLAAAGVIAGAAAGLRALGAARRSLRAQLISSAGYLGGGLAGALIAGSALGASWGSTILLWCGAVLWWLQLRAGLRDHAAEQQKEPGTVARHQAETDSAENGGAENSVAQDLADKIVKK